MVSATSCAASGGRSSRKLLTDGRASAKRRYSSCEKLSPGFFRDLRSS